MIKLPESTFLSGELFMIELKHLGKNVFGMRWFINEYLNMHYINSVRFLFLSWDLFTKIYMFGAFCMRINHCKNCC